MRIALPTCPQLRETMKLALIPLLATLVAAAPSAPGWRFDLKAETSGIVALEAIVVSPTLVLFFDRASNDPLQINNHSAWGALWNLESSTVQPLDVFSNSFCGSGALISNGSMVCTLHCDRPRSGTLTRISIGQRRRRSGRLYGKPGHPPG